MRAPRLSRLLATAVTLTGLLALTGWTAPAQPPDKGKKKNTDDTYDFMGPSVSRSQALDTSAALRERITAHPRIMVLNDEAHHVWDPDSAWNEAISHLHETTRKRGGGLVAQLDLSATPKDNRGNVFRASPMLDRTASGRKPGG